MTPKQPGIAAGFLVLEGRHFIIHLHHLAYLQGSGSPSSMLSPCHPFIPSCKKSGLPWWLSGKVSACQCRRCGFSSWVRKIPWRRKWQLTPVLLPGESRGQKRQVGYSPWDRQESDTTKQQQQRRFTGHEFEQTPGDSARPGSLVCCSPWGRKESDTTEQLNNSNHNNFTDTLKNTCNGN